MSDVPERPTRPADGVEPCRRRVLAHTLERWAPIVIALCTALGAAWGYLDHDREIAESSLMNEKFKATLAAQAVERGGLELHNATGNRLRIREDVQVIDENERELVVSVSAEFENDTESAQEITLTLLRVYTGQANVPPAREQSRARLVNPAGQLGEDPYVAWKQVALRAGVYTDKHDTYPVVLGRPSQAGGGGTARLDAGLSSRFETLVVVPRDAGWFGVRLDAYVDGKGKDAYGMPVAERGDVYNLRFYRPLAALARAPHLRP